MGIVEHCKMFVTILFRCHERNVFLKPYIGGITTSIGF